MIVLIGIGLQPAVLLDGDSGATWAEAGAGGHTAWQILAWVLSIAATLGIITGAVFLMPAVTAFVGSFFVDEIADEVERDALSDRPARHGAAALARADRRHQDRAARDRWSISARCRSCCSRGSASSSCSSPPPICSSREYFLLAAMRFRPPDEAKAMRRAHRAQMFLAGLLIALFVSIPIVNLATPLFAMAMMVHMHKRLSGERIELIERGLSLLSHSGAAGARSRPADASCPATCTDRR